LVLFCGQEATSYTGASAVAGPGDVALLSFPEAMKRDEQPTRRSVASPQRLTHACARARGFFPQSFDFTDGRIRGCVPLDMQIDRQRRIHHVTASLFDRSCQRQGNPS
jgi:hypothetical protein